ncbi:MAG: peptidylprolyl isomerase [Lysinibacillus sp.]
MKKMMKLALIPFAAIAILAGCSNQDSRSVAEIGDEKITEAELNEMLQKQHGTTMLDTLISYKIVELEAKKAEIEVTDEEVEAEYEQYSEQYGGVDGMMTMLKEYNMTEDDVREDIRIYLLTLKLLENQVEVTDDEILAFFEENKSNFATPESITASHILVEEEALAKELIKRINNGEDFTELAKEYSVEEGVADTGGSLGTFGRGEMVAEFEEAAFAMEVGELSKAPVKTEYGYHVILIEDKVAGEDADFESSKDEARKMLLEERMDEAYTPWLEEKYEEYDVKRNLFE